MEDKYINLVKPEYNIAPQAGNTFGYRHSEEVKSLIKLIIQKNVGKQLVA
jgi:hypothetical protein